LENKKLNTLIESYIGVIIALAFIPIFIFDWNASGINVVEFNFKQWIIAFIGKVFFVADVLLLIFIIILIYIKAFKFNLYKIIIIGLIIFIPIISILWSMDKTNTILHIVFYTLILIVFSLINIKFNWKIILISFLCMSTLHLMGQWRSDWIAGLAINRAVFGGFFNFIPLLIFLALPFFNKKNQLLVLFCIILIPSLIILTSSRTSLMVTSIPIGYATYLFYNIKRKYAFIFLITTITLTLLTFTFIAGDENKAHLNPFTSSQSIKIRINQIAVVINPKTQLPFDIPNNHQAEVIQYNNNKLLGHGFYNSMYFNQHLIHNVYANIWSELGVFSLFFFGSILYVLMKTPWKYKIALLIIFITSIADPYYYQGTFATPILTPIILGLSINAIKNKQSNKKILET